MKKLCSLVLLCLFVFPLTGIAEEAVFNWDVYMYGCETAVSMQATEDVLQYDGSTAALEHEAVAPEGFLFLLLQLHIEKTAPGGEGFAWECLSFADQNGTQYLRMDNDTFLEYYGYERLPATTLRIGTYDGFIAFEVPDSIDLETIALFYQSPTQGFTIPFTEKPEGL